MKKVLNWTVGSFFRTIGRTIAFIVMGGLIYYLLSYNGIGLKDLFFDNVKAEEIGTYDIGFDEVYYQDSSLTQRFNVNGWYDYKGVSVASSINSDFTNTEFWFNNHFNLTKYKGGYITIPFYLNLPQVSTTTTSTIYGQDYCDRFTWGAIDSYNQVTRWDCNRVDSGQDSTVNDREYIYPQIQLAINLIYNTGYVDACSFDNTRNIITCPVTKAVDDSWYISRISIQTKVFYASSYSGSYYLYLHRKVNTYSSAIDSINSNIENQTQQQQQQHEEMMDSNTTEAEEEASSFFDDFEAPDIGGLSSIVTAPLNTIRSLLNSTCTNLQLPLPYMNNKYLTLPCMNSIYTEHFGAFFTIYQTIILAIIAYRCIRSIFFDIHGFTNPSDDRIEVMDL